MESTVQTAFRHIIPGIHAPFLPVLEIPLPWTREVRSKLVVTLQKGIRACHHMGTVGAESDALRDQIVKVEGHQKRKWGSAR